jgi:translocation and assembly module TamA
MRLHAGELYQPSKIEAARRDLASLPVFSSVGVEAGHEIAADGRIPIIFTFRERPRHVVAFTGAYSSDLGGSVKATWSNRNLFGNAEQLNLSVAGSDIGGTATTGLGYDFAAQFVKPDFLSRGQSLEFDLGILKQNLIAYDQKAIIASGFLHRPLWRLWTGSLGLSSTWEQIRQEGINRGYTLLALPLALDYDSTGRTDPLQDPTHGIRASLLATPTESFGPHNSAFAILQASASTYLDASRFLHERSAYSVIAFRGLIGDVIGATQFQLPPDQRFYAGGSATVRGFKYQSIGPLFADGTPIGGTAIDTGTIEIRQRLFGNFGAAAFVDAGQVSARNEPFLGTLRIGTGAGLRYYTPIGPIRLDVGVPVNRPPGGDAFEIYIGLGQAF